MKWEPNHLKVPNHVINQTGNQKHVREMELPAVHTPFCRYAPSPASWRASRSPWIPRATSAPRGWSSSTWCVDRVLSPKCLSVKPYLEGKYRTMIGQCWAAVRIPRQRKMPANILPWKLMKLASSRETHSQREQALMGPHMSIFFCTRDYLEPRRELQYKTSGNFSFSWISSFPFNRHEAKMT